MSYLEPGLDPQEEFFNALLENRVSIEVERHYPDSDPHAYRIVVDPPRG